METVENRLRELKETIYDLQLEHDYDSDFAKLIQLKEIDDELFETLLLLHSNYKSSLQTLKFSNLKAMSLIIDSNLEMITTIKSHIAKEITKVAEDNKEKEKDNEHPIEKFISKLYSPVTLVYISIVGVISLIVLYHFIPNDVHTVFKNIKTIVRG